MKSQVEVFIKLCQRYLDGQICTSDYIVEFEALFIASEITLSEREFVVFDSIYTSNARFEPNSKLRKSDKYLIDKAELLRLIQKGVTDVVA
jgi:hypothetical protein